MLIEVDRPCRTTCGTLPTPTLRHCHPGATIRIAGENKLRVILDIDDHYAYFANDDCASLCCAVDSDWMVFGDGGGWRVRTIQIQEQATC